MQANITTTPTLPTVHLNGTSRRDLQQGYDAAADKLRDFVEAWGAVEFNARDYYVQSPDAYPTARDERCQINAALAAIKEHIDAIRFHLYDV